MVKCKPVATTNSMLEKMEVAPTPAKTNSENNKLVAEIQNKCNQIKGLILQEDIGQATLPNDFEEKNIVFNERNIGNDFFNDGTGIKLLGELKTDVIKYNQSKTNATSNLIPVEHSVLAIDAGKLSSYTNLFMLNGITQLQMYLANAEN